MSREGVRTALDGNGHKADSPGVSVTPDGMVRGELTLRFHVLLREDDVLVIFAKPT